MYQRSGSGGLSPSPSNDAAALHKRRKDPSIAKCIASAREAFKDCSEAQLRLWKFVGASICLSCAVLYYAVPFFSLVVLPLWLLLSRVSPISVVVATAWITLAAIPCRPSPFMQHSRIWRSVALYFDGEVWFERNIKEFPSHQKPIVWLMFPHGVISFGGWTFGSLITARPSLTASASVLLAMPILKHMLGVFGLVSGSRNSLKHQLKDKKMDVCIYPGGVAELFLSSPEQEQLYFDHRKGCIKLALETGSDINVAYLFGNTMMFRLLISQTSAKLSRAIKSSLTLFWGRRGSPLPYNTKVVVTVGPTIELPDYSYRTNELTMEVIEREHARVRKEILRLYEAYKHLHPGYANKTLTIC